jgi:hypothetical protein
VSATYSKELDEELGVWMHVDFVTKLREVIDYAVVLCVAEAGETHTVRLYDGAHGINELHRYTRESGKQAAKVFHVGTLGEGMRAAIDQVGRGYLPMIESWRAT